MTQQIKCSLVSLDEDLDKFSKGIHKHLKTSFKLNYLDGEVAHIDEEYPYHYPDVQKRFTWKFIAPTEDMEYKIQRTAFQEAFNSIQRITDRDIDYEFNNTKFTNHTVAFLDDISIFDNKLSVLAQAYLYAPNSPYNGVIQFNDSPNSKFYFTPLGWPVPAWMVDSVNFKPGDKNPDGSLLMRASMPSVMIGMHEICHSFGYRHDTIHPESLMNPWAKNGYSGDVLNPAAFIWPQVDVVNWVKYYGSSGLTPWQIQRWDERRTRPTTYTR